MKKITTILCCILLILTACGKEDPDLIKELDIAESEPDPIPEPVAEPEPVPVPVFSAADAYQQSVTIAEDVVRSFALGSKMGDTLAIKNVSQQKALSIVQEAHPPKTGELLLTRVYTQAIPRIANSRAVLYPTNWKDWQWVNSTNKKTTVPAFSSTIVAELFAAKTLNGAIDAGDKYDGALLSIGAAMQAEYLTFNKYGKQFVDLDEQGDPLPQEYSFMSQVKVLHAFSRLADFSDESIYAGELKHDSVVGYTNQIFNELMGKYQKSPEVYAALSTSDVSRVIEAYTIFAGITDSPKWTTLAYNHVIALTDALQQRIGSGGKVEGASKQSLAQADMLITLAYAYSFTGQEKYKSSMEEVWQWMKKLWDGQGFLTEEGDASYTYTASELARIFHALNAVTHVLELDEQKYFVDFFTHSVINSGLLQAEFRNTIDTIPQTADSLQATAFLSAVSYAGKWKAEGEFVTEEAMALAAALLQGAEDNNGGWRIKEYGYPEIADREDASAEDDTENSDT